MALSEGFEFSGVRANRKMVENPKRRKKKRSRKWDTIEGCLADTGCTGVDVRVGPECYDPSFLAITGVLYPVSDKTLVLFEAEECSLVADPVNSANSVGLGAAAGSA